MKKVLLILSTLFLLSSPSYASHIKGGFFSYQYLGPGIADPVNSIRYKITLTEYLICTSSGSNTINFTVFNGNGQFLQDVSINIKTQYDLAKLYDEPCISGDQRICFYKIAVYEHPSIELPRSASGYIFSHQRCCRINGIQNLSGPSSASGNTFTITIPGTAVMPGAEINSSPLFPVNDTAVVCNNSTFQYSFQASDTDGDSLSYQFCDAFNYQGSNSSPLTAAPPPYFAVPYVPPFSGTQPMGASVTINPVTGVISGTAPVTTGQYVVCVCVSEYRNGVLLGVTRKELHIDVRDFEPLNASPYSPPVCDGFTANFRNIATTTPGTDYLWTFGEPSSGALNTSASATPSHTYASAGTYTVKLKVSIAGLCVDSSSTLVNVFPGFYPGFTTTGTCFTNPFQFTDTTRTDYGVVDSWSWNFGDNATLADTSHLQNPQWTYSTFGTNTVTLTVGNSKGCIKTISFPVTILDKPLLTKAFSDTLICTPGSMQLSVTGTGIFNWTPLTNIINPNTANPTVNPAIDTWYFVNLNDNGCINKDSILVKVANGVSLTIRADTTICLNDTVQLNVVTNGLQFQWTPAATLNDATIKNPVATPVAISTTYQVRATIGSCFATDEITINTVPYPVANAGPDQDICYHSSVQLSGSHNGNSFSWSPSSYLDNPNNINPVSSSPRSISYILTVMDNRGCPKPSRDTVLITALPRVKAFAGRDTTVIVGQPLQLNGSGGINYVWSPSTGLSNTSISNPIGIYNSSVDSVRYKLVVTDIAGCADSSFLTVKVFKTNPYVFVPSGFTPNNDGLNDVLRPIAVGIGKLNYFNVYNRWGQLVFATAEIGKGWDGKIGGLPQQSGVFVWMISAIDYTGKPFFIKGTFTLIK